MSSTKLATGPMIAALDKVFEKMKAIDEALWNAGEIGIRPEYLFYGVPDKCSMAMAFNLMLSLGEEYKRKKQMLKLLDDHGVEKGVEEMLRLIEEF